MEIKLKNLKVSLSQSEETTAFTAEIVIDGVTAGYAKNDGRGGCNCITAYPEHRPLMQRAEDYFMLQPRKQFPAAPEKGIREGFSIPMSLDVKIDDLVYDELKKKDAKKLEKKMETTIMWGVPRGTRYTQVKFKVPLSQIPLIQLQSYIDKYKRQFQPGEQFLNTNLERLGVRL